MSWPWTRYELLASQGDDKWRALKEKYNLSDEVVQYVSKMHVSPEERNKIMNYAQKSAEWLLARKGRVTASVVAVFVGHDPYKSQMSGLKSTLWDTFKGNVYTRWGNDHEDDGRQVFERYIKQEMAKRGEPHEQFQITETGLIVSPEHPWIGVSPDGLCWVGDELVFGLEIKCPQKMYDQIPPQYYDQIQLTMAVLHIPTWYFVVWTPTITKIDRYEFDEAYWSTILLPNLERFYMCEYAPRLLLKEQGLLQPMGLDKIDPPLDVVCDEPGAKRQKSFNVLDEFV